MTTTCHKLVTPTGHSLSRRLQSEGVPVKFWENRTNPPTAHKNTVKINNDTNANTCQTVSHLCYSGVISVVTLWVTQTSLNICDLLFMCVCVCVCVRVCVSVLHEYLHPCLFVFPRCSPCVRRWLVIHQSDMSIICLRLTKFVFLSI